MISVHRQFAGALLTILCVGSALGDAATTSGTQPMDTLTSPPGMVYIPGGVFLMGTNDPSHWPAERPTHPVRVNAFFMDAYEVTNADFANFIEATGYVTTAETTPTLEEIMGQVPPGTPPPPPETLVPGALVFNPPERTIESESADGQWWKWTPGASWRHPEGPDSNIAGRETHPVVMVSWFDAQAYAKWAGKRLPTEAEWECAARGGLSQKEFVWGNEFQPGGKLMANVWQGEFPHNNLAEDGFARTAPVGSFDPNGYGLYDMGGNVWEWCNDWYQADIYSARSSERVTDNPKGPAKPYNPNTPALHERIIRGGSFLCHYSYCSSYRPSARQGNAPDTGMSHTGFRLAKDAH